MTKKKNWFQKLIVELWSGEVSYRGGVGGGGNYGEGTEWKVYLRNVIDFLFDGNHYSNFVERKKSKK